MTTQQWYACTGVTKNGGRCRNQSGHCKSQHGRFVTLPDAVLVKFRVNLTWSRRLQDAGVRLDIINWAQGDARRAEHARSVRRNPNVYRKNAADAGVPVFGPDGLDGAVSVGALLQDLMDVGFHFTDAHLERRENRRTDTLVLALSGEGERLTLTPEAVELIQQLFGSTWKTVHVWANPSNERGRVLDTVNIGYRLPDVKPATMLVLADGAWGTTAP